MYACPGYSTELIAWDLYNFFIHTIYTTYYCIRRFDHISIPAGKTVCQVGANPCSIVKGHHTAYRTVLYCARGWCTLLEDGINGLSLLIVISVDDWGLGHTSSIRSKKSSMIWKGVHWVVCDGRHVAIKASRTYTTYIYIMVRGPLPVGHPAFLRPRRRRGWLWWTWSKAGQYVPPMNLFRPNF